MPTGYTAGIVNGKTTNFEDFAKDCMRAFGATLHMRDEPSDKEYEPQIPSEYHMEALEKAKDDLRGCNGRGLHALSDKEILDAETKRLNESKQYYMENIVTRIKCRERLTFFLDKAKAFQPPTPEHEGIKKFMIEQLETTMDHDGNPEYSQQSLESVEASLANIDVKEIREQMIWRANRDIQYHAEEYGKEVKRCNESNKWVEDLLGALCDGAS